MPAQHPSKVTDRPLLQSFNQLEVARSVRPAARSTASPVSMSNGRLAKVTRAAAARRTIALDIRLGNRAAHTPEVRASAQIRARLAPMDVMPAQRRMR